MVTRYTEGQARSSLEQESLVAYPVPLTNLRVWDAMHTNLPGTAANDDMGLIGGTFGTDVPTAQGVDFGGAATDERCRFQWALPPEYVAGQTVMLRLSAGMITTVSDENPTPTTVDVEVYESNRVGVAGGGPTDLCATAAQGINSLTLADKDFTITPTNLAPGDLLDVRLTFGGADTTNAGIMICEIAQIEFLLDIKG